MTKLLTSWPVVTGSFLASLTGVSILIKEYMNPRYLGDERLEGKTAIVTGSNTGIGKEVARQLAKRRARVIMACRNEEKCQEARKEIVLETNNSNVVCRTLDLASLESVRSFADKINADERRLHILVNNAGIMNCPKKKTEDGFEMQFGVNHLGHFLLTMLLLDKLKSSEPSRIVVVSSCAHLRAFINFDDLNADKNYNAKNAYAQSKLANVLFARKLAQILKQEDSNVFVYSVHPGLVNTEIFRYSSFYNSITGFFIKPLLWFLFSSPKLAVHSILYCILDPKLANFEASGKYYSKMQEFEPSKLAQSDILAKKLWMVSEKWTGLS